MDEVLHYEIIYTESAVRDIEEKADYIAYQLKSPETAVAWYRHLRTQILDNLSSFPLKYALYDSEKWKSKGIRLFLAQNDIILYSVNLAAQCVYIRAVCTRGRDLDTLDLDE